MTYFNMFLNERLIDPPKHIEDNLILECIVGSHGFGIATETSDIDICGISIPPREITFPFENGKYIFGFGKQPEIFHQFKSNNNDGYKILLDGQEYEITIHNIVDFFRLAMENNPNIIESLFAREESVIFQTDVGKMLRENKHIFLHKGFFKKFVCYAQSMLGKIEQSKKTGNREILYQTYGYDTKNAACLIRLLYEAEQLLITETLDVKKDCEFFLSIRNGEVPLDDIYKIAKEKNDKCYTLFENTRIQSYPNEVLIRELLMKCLETHWSQC